MGKTSVNERRCDGCDAGPSAAIAVDLSYGSVRSNFSDASPATVQNPLSLLSPENIGLPLTRFFRVMEICSKAILEEVYDSDMQFGLFIQDGVEEE